VLQKTILPNDLVEDVLAYMTIDSRQRVVQEVDVRVTVDCTRQADSLLLATAQIDTLQVQEV
jgi:hypothetical protein